MAYTTKTEIESEFKNIDFGTTTNITENDVVAFIAEADALIDTHVGARYAVPITASSPIALNLMKLCSRTLVAARVRAIMAVKQASNQDANHEGRGAIGFNTSDVMKLLQAIRDGKQTLADATPAEAGGGFSSYNQANGVKAKVRKDEKQW